MSTVTPRLDSEETKWIQSNLTWKDTTALDSYESKLGQYSNWERNHGSGILRIEGNNNLTGKG